MDITPLGLSGLAIAILFCASLIALALNRQQGALVNVVFLLNAVAALLSLCAGVLTLWFAQTETAILPIGLPDLPFYVRIDPLSGFFLTIISITGLIVSIYSLGYVRELSRSRPITRLAVFYSLFLAGMLLVLICDDSYFFIISWELMALSSYMLVCFEDERAEARKAAFTYLVVAHAGAILILLSFGLMAGFGAGGFGGYTFDSMRRSAHTGLWSSAAFLLAFFGFSAKAGLVPMHAWLPEAHPAAPGNVSALMSAVMLKTAIYGIIRVSFDLLGITEWWWGGLVLVFGLASTLFGVLWALIQNDLKRLLAYSSIENIGIICIGLGLAMTFSFFKMPLLSALSLTAALYHALNHSVFKGLLFMGAGAIAHATHERDMDKMGGLIRKLPWTAPLFLTGCLSIAALPPLNGFVSEWLMFQSFLLSPALPNRLLNVIFPLGAAMLALAGTLGAACFVKVFGVVFLGQWRGRHQTPVKEVGASMKLGMVLGALLCLCLGIAPYFVIGMIDNVTASLVGSGLLANSNGMSWFWITPVSQERASYSAPMVLLGIVAVFTVVYLVTHARKTAIKRGPAWDCGFEKLTNRMQYNSTSFAMPFRRVFGFVFNVKEGVRDLGQGRADKTTPRFTYSLRIRDPLWYVFYEPLAKASFWVARKAGRVQHGRIQFYLLYSFITLIFLLVFA